MSKIIRLNDSTTRCPLCQDFMEKAYDDNRRVFILACRTDKVAIRCDDPFVGQWEQAKSRLAPEELECPNCNASMLVFATSTGYMKLLCPKKSCRMAMEMKEPDRETPTTEGEATKGLVQ